MAIQLRILLILGALLALGVVARRVRRNKILMDDAIFWLVLALVLVFVALFPGLAIICASELGFISASNFVFLIIVGLLLVKVFGLTGEVSMLRHKVNELTQEIALRERDDHEQ